MDVDAVVQVKLTERPCPIIPLKQVINDVNLHGEDEVRHVQVLHPSPLITKPLRQEPPMHAAVAQGPGVGASIH